MRTYHKNLKFGVVLFAFVGASLMAGSVWAEEPAGAEAAEGLVLTESAICSGVEERLPTGKGETFATGTRVWTWLQFENAGDEAEIQMVWKKDGKSVFSTSVNIKRSKSWRTWSRKKMRKGKDVGAWTVDIVAPGGKVLKTLNFTVTEG